ncbi:hypothetical protein LTS14_001264 [Recurvomyces mirabilis]|uniref:uncharacterized protein n=1 Tax=Recurvomyces mirabilis TaxID=574656 RepID=UPI002DDEA00D|nr:hypothetical protein LTS14_001264 [Recurvomyces mirabilis]
MARHHIKKNGVEMRADAVADGSPMRDGDMAGSSQDHADMQRLGKRQELKGTIWMFLATWILTIPVVASMAEMASMVPTAGGQYHWARFLNPQAHRSAPLTTSKVSEFAPPSMQKFLSSISGWLSALGWQAFIASAAFQSAATILTVAAMNFPSYTPQVWQITLLTMGVGVFAISVNAFGAKRLPLFEGAILFFYIIGFFVICIPLWVLAPKAPLSAVFGDFENYGGWSSLGGGVIVGQMAASAAFIGVDSAVHMSEEVKDASITVPRMMMGTILLNGVTGFIMVITYVLSIQLVEDQILGTTSPFPFIGVFATATNSTAGGIGMTVSIIVMTLSMTINATAAASRQAWSFARDGEIYFTKRYH